MFQAFRFVSIGLLVALAAGAGWMLRREHRPEPVYEPASHAIEPAPLCPWRTPEADVQRFFPGATVCRSETRILSGQRLELARRLGRQPRAEENSLELHRVLRDAQDVGTILTCRVAGEHGAIEIVLALDPGGAVCGLRLQRSREPAAAAAALEGSGWLASFQGKRAGDLCQVGVDLAGIADPGRASADAIAEGVRSLLILRDAAQGAPPHPPPHRDRP
jgi:hypothetical protein